MKIVITVALLLVASFSFGQTKKEIVKQDTAQVIVLSKEQVGAISSILQASATMIMKSDTPAKEAVKNVQELQQILMFFKQQLEQKPKK